MNMITRTFDRMQVVYKAYNVETDSIETSDCYVYTKDKAKAAKSVEKQKKLSFLCL